VFDPPVELTAPKSQKYEINSQEREPMVIRRVRLSILCLAAVAAAGVAPFVRAGQSDQKPTTFYVNAAPSSSSDTSQPTVSTVAAQSAAPAVVEKTQPLPVEQTATQSASDFENRPVRNSNNTAHNPVVASKPVSSGVSGTSPLRMIFALTAVLGLILIGAIIFRRLVLTGRRGASDRKVIKILAKNMIAPRQYVYMLKLGSRLLVVGVSPSHMATLDTIDDPDEIARLTGSLEQDQPHSISNGFSQWFQRHSGDYDSGRGGDQAVDETGLVDDSDRRQWSQAHGELHSLLDKVRSLTRMQFRSPMR
jgi:flagellar biogenesis protein FliO